MHPVDTADRAALDGRAVAAPVLAWLSGQPNPTGGIRLHPGPGLRWLTPGLIVGSPALSVWAERAIRAPRLVLEQDGRVLLTRRHRWPVGPGRVLHLPGSLVEGLDPRGGDATLSLLG